MRAQISCVKNKNPLMRGISGISGLTFATDDIAKMLKNATYFCL